MAGDNEISVKLTVTVMSERTGQWCFGCNLPSAVLFDLLFDGFGQFRMERVVACTECGGKI